MPLDLQSIKSVLEASIEDLVRVADTKINWNNAASTSASKKGYVYLPGVYVWEADKSFVQPSARPSCPPTARPVEDAPVSNQSVDSAVDGLKHTPNVDSVQDDAAVAIDHFPPPSPGDGVPMDDNAVPPGAVGGVDTSDDVAATTEALPTPLTTPHSVVDNSVAAFLMNDDDIASIGYTLVLHGDNTFEYVWKQKRTGARPMEHKVELAGTWHTPVLNRDRYGERDQRVFLDTGRARFQRVSNYDPATNAWKQTLRTLTRNGDDWVVCGENDRGLPPMRMVFNVLDNHVMESIGAQLPHDIVSHGIPSRVLAGLTKKAGMKLGAPIDVMTDKWLPCRKLCLQPVSRPDIVVKPFNPLLCLADALKKRRKAAPSPPARPITVGAHR
ncbi:hypothetical protein H310_05190 [Aphanomyces invadans]|uniref:Uncharacterized protein n=1 Tax=Aphanomyces invadans TaxID=157072 RepID=A0A024UDX8_9STRA|nr:hypothetical protein H310_05190 [Aphanomyces invadans]ETW03833.1 hypothetical protein H310_05190 [Aphanomyces invadans]|eukprot:XP_008868062.1 hypothetical protein H310_05190 [Aphanomyces invadans]